MVLRPRRPRAGTLAVAFPAARFTAELEDVLADGTLDAVVVATPVPTHAHVAERALAAGKHCFVEKPLAQDGASAERLISLADAAERDGS